MSVAPVITVDHAEAVAIALLRRWLARMVPAEAARWLDGEIERQRESADERRLGMAFGLVGRRIGRTDLSLSPEDLAAARTLRTRWRPETWGTDEAARVAILLATWRGDDEPFAARVDRLCTTGELTEHIACLKGFAVFPTPERLLGRAREAVRSSVQPVFEALACFNPYPADWFDEVAFNLMVVKCVFSGVPIGAIVGTRCAAERQSRAHAAGPRIRAPCGRTDGAGRGASLDRRDSCRSAGGVKRRGFDQLAPKSQA
jgi:hypothetical protein